MNFYVPNDKIPSNINMDFIKEIRTRGGLMLKCHKLETLIGLARKDIWLI